MFSDLYTRSRAQHFNPVQRAEQWKRMIVQEEKTLAKLDSTKLASLEAQSHIPSTQKSNRPTSSFSRSSIPSHHSHPKEAKPTTNFTPSSRQSNRIPTGASRDSTRSETYSFMSGVSNRINSSASHRSTRSKSSSTVARLTLKRINELEKVR